MRVVIADRRDRLHDLARQVEFFALPLAAGQVLAAAVDRAVGLDYAGAADADPRRDFQLLAFGGVEQFLQHLVEAGDGLVPRWRIVAVAPKIALPHLAGG